MQITKKANGKNKIKISRTEWETMGKEAGWMKVSQVIDDASKQNIANTVAGAVSTFINQYPQSQDGGQFELETVEETLASLLPINREVVKAVMNRVSGLITNVRFGKADISSLQGLTTPQGIIAIIDELAPQSPAVAPQVV